MQPNWTCIAGILLMVAGALGAAAALFYIWFIQLLLRYARDSLWDGAWLFAICLAGFAVSLFAVYLGYYRLFRRPPATGVLNTGGRSDAQD